MRNQHPLQQQQRPQHHLQQQQRPQHHLQNRHMKLLFMMIFHQFHLHRHSHQISSLYVRFSFSNVRPFFAYSQTYVHITSLFLKRACLFTYFYLKHTSFFTPLFLKRSFLRFSISNVCHFLRHLLSSNVRTSFRISSANSKRSS
jgi:hypothetical protein